MYLLYECRSYLFNKETYSTGGQLVKNWKSTGINNYLTGSNLDGGTGGINYPILKDDGRIYARFPGVYLK